MNNLEIRKALKRKGLCQWQLAEKLKISESTMTRKMRKEIATEEKENILKIIEKMEV